MSVASVAAANTASKTGTSATGGASGDLSLTKLTSNFQDFLSLLMTQLKNQDPTSPMDTNQFTTELVQFSSVEQQISTNTSLTQLIQLTQSGQLLQSSAIVGHKVEVAGSNVILQNGSGAIRFDAPAAGSVQVSVHNASGAVIGTQTVDAAKGSNDWTWNGMDASGTQNPDGAYAVTVASISPTGGSTAITPTMLATATGVDASGSALKLKLGSAEVPFSDVRSVLD